MSIPKKVKVSEYANCPIRYGMQVLGGRWPLIILHHIESKPLRYGEIRKKMKDISEKMLIQTLRTLEEEKLIIRKDYMEVPPRVEYAITKKGLTATKIIPILFDLFQKDLEAKEAEGVRQTVKNNL